MRRCLVLAGLLVAASAPAPAVEPKLGRLFFTPEQRAQLDAARAERARGAPVAEASEEAPQVPEVVTYSGLIRRNDGRTTIWINNRVLDEGVVGGPQISGRVRPDGALVLQVPQSGRGVELKVGQSVELLTGSIAEGYARRAPSGPEGKPAPKSASEAKPATGPLSETKPPSAPRAKPPGQRSRAREDPDEPVGAAALPATAPATPPSDKGY
jgi:hypothetical protein